MDVRLTFVSKELHRLVRNRRRKKTLVDISINHDVICKQKSVISAKVKYLLISLFLIFYTMDGLMLPIFQHFDFFVGQTEIMLVTSFYLKSREKELRLTNWSYYEFLQIV